MDILIDAETDGTLVRDMLKTRLGYSMSLIKRLKFSEDGIKVNGNWVTVRYVLREGDVLSLHVEDREEEVSPYIIPADLPIGILYEDEYITAVDKPYNMPSHPSQGHHLDTVANALAHRYEDRVYVFRPVNRLDRDTSGCMLTANTKDASYKMYCSMVEGKIKKHYIAVTDGVPEVREGVFTSYMHRKAESIIEREECAPDAPEAKLAVTEYRVLCDNGEHAIVEASPVTGRTHQIRLHLLGAGCPITGDTLYGNESPYITRHALHSYRTTFPHPATGEMTEVCAPLPEDMRVLLDKLGLEMPGEGYTDNN